MIIAFGHKKQQGKDSIANAILAVSNSTSMLNLKPRVRVEIRSFAEPIYEICEKMIPEFRHRNYYNQRPGEKEQIIPRLGSSPRNILIGVGESLKACIGPDCFAVSLMENINDCDSFLTLITDLRFPCEAKAVQERGGLCIKVVRPGSTQADDSADSALDGWDGWDRVITNDGSLAQLRRKAKDLYREFSNYG